MAKKRTKSTIGGPFVIAAVICERVLVEKDEANTLVRVVDRVTLPPTAVPPLSQGQEGKAPEPFSTDLILFILLKSGDAKGEYAMRVDTLLPSGREITGNEFKVNFLGGIQGVHARSPLPVYLHESGLHWYSVHLNGKVITRVPLDLVYAPPKSESEQPSGDASEEKS